MNRDIYNELVHLSSRHNKNKEDSTKGLITTDAADVISSKITIALINLLDENEIV